MSSTKARGDQYIASEKKKSQQSGLKHPTMVPLLTPRVEGVNFFSHLMTKRAGAGVKKHTRKKTKRERQDHTARVNVDIHSEAKEERKETQQVDLEQSDNEEEERAAQLAKVGAFVLPHSHSCYTIASSPAADHLGITINSRS